VWSMPFYKDTVFGPSEHSQLEGASSADSSPAQDRPSPARQRTFSSAALQGSEAAATRPFRMPRQILSPASSPIPISPTYHSYHEDDDEDEEDNNAAERGGEGGAGVSEEEAVADELVLDEFDGYPNNRLARHSKRDGKGRKDTMMDAATPGRQRGQPPSERYLSLPRDAAVDDDDEEEDDDDGVDSRRGKTLSKQSRRHKGLVSSRPRASPQKQGKPTTAAPSSLSTSRREHHKDIRSDYEDEDEDDERPVQTSRNASRNGAPPRRPPRTRRSPSPLSSSLSRSPSGSSSDSAAAAEAAASRRGKVSRTSSTHLRRSTKNASASHRARSPSSSQQPPPPPTPPAYCDRCGYPLPEEMEDYLHETSTYESVPRPRCPACGVRLRLRGLHGSNSSRKGREGRRIKRDSSGDSGEDEEEAEGKQDKSHARYDERQRQRPRRAQQQQQQPCRSPVRNQKEEVNLYSDPEAGDGDGDGAEALRQHGKRRYVSAQPPLAEGVVQHAIPASHGPVLIPKMPHLTLEFMPRNLASTMKNKAFDTRQRGGVGGTPDDRAADDADDDEVADYRSAVRRRRRSSDLDYAGVPWATTGCTACCWQGSVALAGIFCCCAMPCVLFRERQQLLFHEVESRYICCAGAFPCCVPPASLRPELYYTIKTEYIDVAPPTPPAGQRRRRAARRDPDRPRYWHNAVEVSRESASESTSSEADVTTPHARERRHSSSVDVHPPVSSAPPGALRSVTGVASPSSLVNPRTGLPLEGCYHNIAASRGKRAASEKGDDAVDGGTGCCDCVTCVDGTLVWDCNRGCCLSCIHPTAHCLSCPRCCLCCELTFCMPCALWANRLLIRQHYNLAPDPAIDGGAACCYSCCLQCCTCQAISVVSQHHSSRVRSARKREAHAATLSCWPQLAASVAACLAAVCCLCPCAACSLAQQRDQMERLGFPLVVEVPPEMEMM
jgi:hypothetical protein